MTVDDKRNSQPVIVVLGEGASLPDADTIARLAATGQEGGQMSGQVAAQKGGQEFLAAQLAEGATEKHGAALGRFPYTAHGEALARGHAVPVDDPHAFQRAFPDRWLRFIRQNFRSPQHVMQCFPVAERTANKWWNGETCGSGAMIAIALVNHGMPAQRILLDGEGEQ